MSDSEDYVKTAIPKQHAITHQDGGSDEISVAALSGELADDQKSTWAKVSGKPTTFTPEAHKASHQKSGGDEISVLNLSGLLADAQTPLAHKTSHQKSGSDEISVLNLSGLLADAQTPLAHKTSHQKSGSDQISVLNLSGLLADAQTPLAHKTSHQNGGSDQIDLTGLFLKARSYRAAAQSIPTGTYTKIEIDTDTFDPANISDLVNHRMTPNKAGYYLLCAETYIKSMPLSSSFLICLYKNGVIQSYGNVQQAPFSTDLAATITDIMYLNGSTDYAELYVQQTSGVNKDLATLQSTNYLSIVGPF